MKNLKKTLAVISSAVMLCCSIAPTIASAEGYQLVEDKYTAEEALAAGFDFNLDGIVSYSDSYTLLQYCSFVSLGAENPDFIITDYIDSAIVEAVETYGDLTGNGIVDLIDATAFLSECKSIIKNGDVNEDGVLDVVDVTKILVHYTYISMDERNYTTDFEYQRTHNVGDFNKDGKIDPVDATQVLQAWALNSMSWQLHRYAVEWGLKFNPLDEDIAYGDINLDGKISVADAVVLQSYIAGRDVSIGYEADLAKDGIIDVFDMIEMRNKLVNGNSWGVYWKQ